MTEDEPGLPSWVEEALDEIFSGFPDDIAALRPARDTYAACLAGAQDSAAPGEGDDRCRTRLLNTLEQEGVDKIVLEALNEVLEALEAEISENT